MGWEQLLAWVSGKVDEQLHFKLEYLVAENRILRDQIKGRHRLADGQRITLAELGAKLGRGTLSRRIAQILSSGGRIMLG